jgi:uncharacterized protein (DUF952 family)
MTVYKICTAAEWDAAVRDGVYRGSAVDLRDGFIHFSTAAQTRETAAKHFAGLSDLVLIGVDDTRLGAALRWEPSRGGALFPHLYAPLPVDAATSVTPLALAADGHRFPDWLDHA